jgi:YfiH family protein
MLQRTVSPTGVVTYVSPLLRQLSVPHAFSTRLGGVSRKPFDSLNLGNPNGCEIQDLRENIRKNYRLLQDAAGCADRELLYLHQIHSATVIRVTRDHPHDNNLKGDALVSDDPSRVLSVRIADCVPVLLSSDDGRIVAAVHAGWRGVIAGVALAALQEVNQTSDSSARRVVVAIGPSISFDAFEVGPEVIEQFEKSFGPDAPIRRRIDGKGHVDLRESLFRQLRSAGVPEQQIDTTDCCTFSNADEFFSHRRDKGLTGRMAAIVAPERDKTYSPRRHHEKNR